MKLYQYPKCSTCRKAVKFLNEKGVEFESIDITLAPPSRDEFEFMLSHQDSIKKLFNTSGVQYRELDMKTRLPLMSNQEAIELLSQNGKLIKRPFLIDLSHAIALIGFKEVIWDKTLT